MSRLGSRLVKAEKIYQAIRSDVEVRSPEAWDWYADGCPCGKPPGECRDHPRARLAQRPPDGDWRVWLMLAGRGFGKNRAGSEWVRSLVSSGKARRIALVAPTAGDARDVIVEGDSGILACCPPWDRPKYEPSKRRLTWPNGAIAITYSADEPNRLRGPQHDAALCDELSSWRRPEAWDNLRFGLRKGINPRVAVITTPKPTALLKRIMGQSSTAKTGGSTFENAANLAPEFLDEMTARYQGTRLGRQELYAELLEVLEGAWFPQFDPARHVTKDAEYIPGVPIRCAIDCGVSRHTGAVLFQALEIDKHRTLINVFGDYYAEGLYSEANALAILDACLKLTGGIRPDRVRLDPASSARTGVGPSAKGEYERAFGARFVEFWPSHLVADGLDQIELLLGPESRPPDLIVHPRCEHLIGAFNGYVAATRAGEFQSYPLDPNHPSEDLMDALRGGIRDAMPQGRKPRPTFRRVDPKKFL